MEARKKKNKKLETQRNANRALNDKTKKKIMIFLSFPSLQ